MLEDIAMIVYAIASQIIWAVAAVVAVPHDKVIFVASVVIVNA